MECEVCVRKLLCVWSPYTGLLGDNDTYKDGENEKEEKKKGVEKENEKEGEGEGHGDDAVALEGDLNNGNTEGIEFFETYIVTHIPSITTLHCNAYRCYYIQSFTHILVTSS